MIILSIRTDKPEAEVGLFDSENQLAYQTWTAHRQLAETIHSKMEELLKSQGKSLQDIEAIICYKGPGSFTGLRIGLSVANALAYGMNIKIVGSSGDNWLKIGMTSILSGTNDKIVLPEYGSPVHLTVSKK